MLRSRLMRPDFRSLPLQARVVHTLNPLLDELALLYERMDRAYNLAADGYGFTCNGCEDSCCRTLFFHHTLTEYLYLKNGLNLLPEQTRRRILQRAGSAVGQIAHVQAGGQKAGVLCPLNDDGRCGLYDHRPMICRLHGIPHVLHRPDGREQVGPGCNDFVRQCGPVEAGRLDRTPLYFELAQLELRMRRQAAYKEKIRLSIAQMVVEDLPGFEF